MHGCQILCVVCLSLVVGLSGAARAAVFQGLGDLQGGRSYSVPVGMSADGTVIVGRSSGPKGYATFRWTRGSKLEQVAALSDDAAEVRATAISGDGSTIVGVDVQPHERACRLDRAGRLDWLGVSSAAVEPSIAYAASADGSIVVGRAMNTDRFEAFRWSKDAAIVRLGDLPGGDFHSAAFATSADGNVVVGTGNSSRGREAFRWTENEGMVGLGDLPGGIWWSDARACSADGAVVVGQSATMSGLEAYRWTRAEGMVGLGDLPGGPFQGEALAVSADGSVVVGTSKTGNDSEAFVWTAAEGMQRLQTVIGQRGGKVVGWTLLAATGISADGSVVVGYGVNSSGRTEAWIADLNSDAAPMGLVQRAALGPAITVVLVAGMVAWHWLRRGASNVGQGLP